MRYELIKFYSNDELNNILISGNDEEIKLLPLSLGEYHSNLEYAQNFCLFLLENSINDEIRANAVLGFSYLKNLDKKVLPLLEQEIKRNREFNDRVEYSVEDIYLFTKWEK
jgi:hypothetical protein